MRGIDLNHHKMSVVLNNEIMESKKNWTRFWNRPDLQGAKLRKNLYDLSLEGKVD